MNEDKESKSPDLSAILSQISSNPKALSMLGSLLGGIGNNVLAPKEEHQESTHEELTVIHTEKHTSFEDRKRLLLALKPFLSPEKCQTIDVLLMVLEAFSVFQKGKRA